MECSKTRDRAQGGGVSASRLGVYQHHGQGTWQGECNSIRDRAHTEGAVSAPGTGHGGGAVSASSLGVYQHHGQDTQQGECISTRDRAQGGGASASGLGCISTTDRAHSEGSVTAPWTGHTGLYPQALGN